MLALFSSMDNVMLAVETGLISWLLLAVGLGGIFLVLVVLKNIFKK